MSQSQDAPPAAPDPVDTDLIAVQLSPNVPDATRLWAYIAHGFQCLIQYDVMAFKMMWVRTPPALQQNQVLQQCRHLMMAMLRRDFAQFWDLIDAMIWDEELCGFVDALRKAVRERACRLISRAYSCIEIDQVCKLIGVPAPSDDLSAWFPGHRTEIINGRCFLIPARVAAPQAASVDFDEMRRYVQFVLKLDDVAI